ncbi:Ribonuclease 3-like protein 3, partial [Mucuna pruriens]
MEEACECEDQIAIVQEMLKNVFNDVPMNDSNKASKETKDLFPQPQSLNGVEAILKYEFKNKCLLEEAFTHASYPNEKCLSYERLEYVGDAVLNLLVTKEQFFEYPDLDSGRLTRLRAANVDTEKLARVCIRHGFHRFLRHRKPRLEQQIQEFTKAMAEYPLHSNGLIDVPKDLANIVESTIGAVFIDCGSSIDIVWE